MTAFVDWLFLLLIPDWLFDLLLQLGARMATTAYAAFAGERPGG